MKGYFSHSIFGWKSSYFTTISAVPFPQESFPTHPAPQLTLPQPLSRLPPLHRQLLGTVVFPPDDGLLLATGIAAGIGASDGSSIERTYASFAEKFTTVPLLEAHNACHNISATGEVNGVVGFINSLRAESRGALSIFLLLVLLNQKWPDLLPQSKEIDICFDSKITIHRSDVSPKHRKDFDVWTEIRRIRQLVPFKIKCKWVRSHQESESDFDLTLPEVILNIAVDETAESLSGTITTHLSTLLIPSSKAAIIVEGKRYHHFPAPIIRAIYHGPPLQAYIMKKTGWTIEQFQSID